MGQRPRRTARGESLPFGFFPPLRAFSAACCIEDLNPDVPRFGLENLKSGVWLFDTFTSSGSGESVHIGALGFSRPHSMVADCLPGSPIGPESLTRLHGPNHGPSESDKQAPHLRVVTVWGLRSTGLSFVRCARPTVLLLVS